LVVVVSTLVGLGLVEALLRVFWPEVQQPFQVRLVDESERGKFCQYHDTLGWAGRPGVDGVYESFDCSHHVHQNALGFRGPDVPFARTRARRLAVLGDSFVWGFGVEDDQIFTALLARASPTPLEVVNLGVSGYGTDQELLLWRLLGQNFKPDTVLLLVTPYTDVFDVASPVRYRYPKPVFRLDPAGPVLENVPVPRRADGRWDVEGTRTLDLEGFWLLRAAAHSAVVSAVVGAATANASMRTALEAHGLVPERQAGLDVEQKILVTPLPDETRRGWEILVALLGVLADEVGRSGAHLVVAAAPTPVQVYPELWDAFRRRHDPPAGTTWDLDSPARILAEACRARGIRLVDLLSGLREAGRSDPYLYYRWNMHWTPAGHRVVADVLAGALATSAQPSP
jgi:lysophospholipase L1-like esterase